MKLICQIKAKFSKLIFCDFQSAVLTFKGLTKNRIQTQAGYSLPLSSPISFRRRNKILTKAQCMDFKITEHYFRKYFIGGFLRYRSVKIFLGNPILYFTFEYSNKVCPPMFESDIVAFVTVG